MNLVNLRYDHSTSWSTCSAVLHGGL